VGVMAVIGWVDTDKDLVKWPDGYREAYDEDSTDEGLGLYLHAAYEQCLEFLPHDAEGAPVVPDPVPERLVLAQVMQARALYRSAVAGSGDRIGPDGMTITVFPMDWTVKNLLRPRRVPRFG
jgi:hypothetical protein